MLFGVMMVMVTWWSLNILKSLKPTQLTLHSLHCAGVSQDDTVMISDAGQWSQWSQWENWENCDGRWAVGLWDEHFEIHHVIWCHLMSFVIDLRWWLCTDCTVYCVLQHRSWLILGYDNSLGTESVLRYRQNRNLQHQLQDVLARSVGDGWWFQTCFSTWEDDLNG